MNRRDLIIFVLAAFIFCGSFHAAEKPDPTGMWKGSYTDAHDQKVEGSLMLKYADGKLTGTMLLPIEITNASFNDGRVEFKVKQGKNDKNSIWY